MLYVCIQSGVIATGIQFKSSLFGERALFFYLRINLMIFRYSHTQNLMLEIR